MQAQTRPETQADATAENPTMTHVPDDVTSPRGKLIYLYLATHGAVTEDDLCDGLGMKRISLYSIVKTLRTDGHIEKADGRYVLA